MADASTLTTAENPKALHNTHSLTSRMVKTKVKDIVGKRFIEAREINGLSQTDAAKALGYKNSAQLSQWEQCKRPPPLHMVAHASKVYRVSVDFLLGVSDDPDRDPRSESRLMLLRSADEMLRGMSQKLCDAILQHTMAGGPANESALMLLDKAAGAAGAIRRYIERNKEQFENSPASSTVAAALDTLDKCVTDSRMSIERHRRVTEIALKRTLAGLPELPLFEAVRLANATPIQ